MSHSIPQGYLILNQENVKSEVKTGLHLNHWQVKNEWGARADISELGPYGYMQ